MTDRIKDMTTYNDPFHEYPPHSHQPDPDHATTCQVCGALIMSEGEGSE